MNQKTAALLIIGDELLAGRVKDENLPFLASELGMLGIKLTEARFIADAERDIILNLLELHIKVDYLFLTGGIGPTHDDITSEAVAKAFKVSYELNDEAYQILASYYKNTGKPFLEGSKKMAYMPKGVQLLYNKLTFAPGFKIKNVFVLPGIPSVMQQIFIDNKHLLETTSPICSKSLITTIPESAFALELEKLQQQYPMLTIGSYPKLDEHNKWTAELVVTSSNAILLAQAFKELENLIQKIKD